MPTARPGICADTLPCGAQGAPVARCGARPVWAHPCFLPGPQRVHGAPVCRCDMFPDQHPDGYAAGGVVCELALPGQRISPHLAMVLSQIWADAFTHAAAAPRLSDEQVRKLRQILT